jgi:hypothetical protein
VLNPNRVYLVYTCAYHVPHGIHSFAPNVKEKQGGTPPLFVSFAANVKEKYPQSVYRVYLFLLLLNQIWGPKLLINAKGIHGIHGSHFSGKERNSYNLRAHSPRGDASGAALWPNNQHSA